VSIISENESHPEGTRPRTAEPQNGGITEPRCVKAGWGRKLAWLAPALVAVLLAWAGWQVAAGTRLDVGTPTDEAYLDGFYDREVGVAGTYRWSGADARISLPAARAPATLALRMVGRPGGTRLTLAGDGQPLGVLELPPEIPRRYLLLWKGGTPLSGVSVLTLRGAAAPSAADPRAVVALVESVELRSLPGVRPPPLWPLLMLGALGALSYAMLRLAGAGSRPALLAALPIGAALGIGWGLARLWVAPYLGTAALEVAAIAATLGILRWGIAHGPRLAEAELFAAFAVGAALIPIYLFADYGWRLVVDWRNLPVLLLPLGLALPWLRGRARSVAVGLILLVSGGYAAGMLYTIFSGDYASDFHAFYRGVAGLMRGDGPLYRIDDIRANPLGATYKYPPTFALLFAPLTRLSFVPAIMTWRVINLGVLIAAALLLLRVYRARLRSWATAALLLLLFSLRPLADTLNYGQLDLLLLLLLAAGLLAFTRGRDAQLGVWIGAAAALKLYPIYLLGFALLQRRWRALLGASAALALLGGLSVAAFGWPIHWMFLHDVLPASGVGTAWVENQTFNGFLNRLLAPDQVRLLPDGGGLVSLATYIWALCLTGLTAWLTRPAGGMRPDIGYGLWIVTMLLILPSAWMHYEALLLIPFFQGFVLARDRAALGWTAAICYTLAWMLLAHGNLWTFFDTTLHGPFWQLILSYKFYGMLLLYTAIVRATARERAALALPARLPAQPGVGLSA
jgi:hypothetical protein